MPRDKTGHFYYSWFPTIFQADTQSLTLAEDGAYRRLLDHYMLTRSPLLDDDRALARIIGIGSDEWEPIKNRIKTYFKPSGNPLGYLTHKFCDEILAKDHSRIIKSKTNGAKGGRPITSGKIKETTHQVTEVKPLTKLNRTKQNLKDKEESKKVSTRSALVYSKEFETLWELYPRRDGSKSKAFENYESAIKRGIDHGRIEQGVRAYAEHVKREGTEQQYIAHASTWLNQKRWESDYSASRDGPARKESPGETTARVAAFYHERADRQEQSTIDGDVRTDLSVTESIR